MGLASAGVLSRQLTGLLFQVMPLDTLSFAAVPLFLLPAAAIRAGRRRTVRRRCIRPRS